MKKVCWNAISWQQETANKKKEAMQKVHGILCMTVWRGEVEFTYKLRFPRQLDKQKKKLFVWWKSRDRNRQISSYRLVGNYKNWAKLQGGRTGWARNDAWYLIMREMEAKHVKDCGSKWGRRITGEGLQLQTNLDPGIDELILMWLLSPLQTGFNPSGSDCQWAGVTPMRCLVGTFLVFVQCVW